MHSAEYRRCNVYSLKISDLRMYIYINIYIHSTYIYIYTYIFIHVYVYTCELSSKDMVYWIPCSPLPFFPQATTQICIHYIYICKNICTCTCMVCIHLSVYIYIYICICICYISIYTYLFMYIYIYTYLYTYVYTHLLYIHSYMQIPTYLQLCAIDNVTFSIFTDVRTPKSDSL